jgi:sarcosine oxidase
VHDVVIIGLGVMGSAAAYHLARRGAHVLGLERFPAPHDRGSSHGRSRVIRQAYFEHPDYVPLLLRAYESWRALERECGRPLLRTTGALMIGHEESPVVRGSVESARTHGLKHRMLSSRELAREYPALRVRPDEIALREEEAGVLFVEDCLAAFQDGARRAGAELRFGVAAPRIGEPAARRTVVTAGPWMPALAPSLPLKIERQVMLWFEPTADVGGIPVFMWDRGTPLFYGIPDVSGDGFKVCFHHGGEITMPDGVRRDVSAEDVDAMRRRLDETIPAINGRLRDAKTCLYTNTPDEHFAIGPMPGRPDVVIGSACSGHGFKFAPVVGEILADLSIEGRTRRPIGLFRPDRF